MVTVSYDRVSSPVGDLLLVARNGGLAGVYLPGHRRGQVIAAGWRRDEPAVARAARQLDEYFAGERRAFDLPLSPAGTAFQRRVWEALGEIPYGATAGYGAIAAAIGRPGAARAVGHANARNPLSIVVPCHRVVGRAGALTGYGGGLEVKRRLLDHERRRARPESALPAAGSG